MEGLPGVLGNKGTLAKYRREQGNISQFLGTGEQNSKNYSTKTFGKCVGTWEHRAILEGNKGTRTPPERPSVWERGIVKHWNYCKDEPAELSIVRQRSYYVAKSWRGLDGNRSVVGGSPGRGGYSKKNWVGVCGPLPKTLTLFMTKICDFPYPIYDLTKTLTPYL